MISISAYQQEHLEAATLVSGHLDSLASDQIEALKIICREYLAFRKDVDTFLNKNFASSCTQKCFQSNLSACCSREGIIAFFADIVINALYSSKEDRNTLIEVLQIPNAGPKCIYLGPHGCLWRIKPIVCQMFLCDPAMDQVFSDQLNAKSAWKALKMREKGFAWPDKKILFDDLEVIFLNAGFDSPLMYLHHSPGLLLVKKRAGL